MDSDARPSNSKGKYYKCSKNGIIDGLKII